MTKNEYLETLYHEKFIKREDLKEDSKDQEGVIEEHNEIDDTYHYYKYKRGELSNDEIDRIVQIKQLNNLRDIKKILKFFQSIAIASLIVGGVALVVVIFNI